MLHFWLVSFGLELLDSSDGSSSFSLVSSLHFYHNQFVTSVLQIISCIWFVWEGRTER